MKIDVVIPNYNGAKIIKKNLPEVVSVFDRHKDTKFIVVDDASNPEDKKDLYMLLSKMNNPKIVLLENEKNHGFATTVNRGVSYSDADLVVLLNSDVVPEKGFIDDVPEKFKENPTLFGIGCMDKSIENGSVVLRGRGIGRWKKGFVVHTRGEVDKSSTFWISGGSSIIRREIFLKLKGFDEIYNPFYWEDIDLSYRAQKSGYEIYFDNKIVVKHLHEEGAIKSNFKKSYVKKIAFRNQLIFIWKNISTSRLFITHLLFLPILILKSIFKNDQAIVGGFFMATKKLPDIISKRKSQKKFYKISDSKILSKSE